LKITEIVFYNTNRAKLVVEIPDSEAYSTVEAPRIPRILFKLFPHMATQRCYNDSGYSFRREAQATEIPHLFEHLIIEIQDQVRRGMGTPFAGETQWNWTVDPRGRFYVTVDYDNEIVALGAIRLAERVINALDSKDIAQIDMTREITRLRELAKISRRFAANTNGRDNHTIEPLLADLKAQLANTAAGQPALREAVAAGASFEDSAASN
jgi:hypothetical protein